MIRDHRKPLSRRAALAIAWGGMVLSMLAVVACVTWVNQRVAPAAMAPRAVQAAPVGEPEPAMPDALWDPTRAELLLLRPILKGETR